MNCAYTIDVEDWFHILDVPSAPPSLVWDTLPSRLESNVRSLLDIFEEAGVRATWFCLGWVARRFPHLVRETAARGHEIASHGLEHRLISTMTPNQFLTDARASRLLLEERSGNAVHGYRAPGFSLTLETAWFFEKLAEAGYSYDASVFPGRHGHGGLTSAPLGPHRQGPIAELPVTLAEVLGQRVCFSGGGYLRLSPLWFIRRMTRQVLAQQRPVIFYVHPREIEPAHPRLRMSRARAFRSYVNLKTTEPKLRALLAEFPGTTMSSLVEREFGPAKPRVMAAGALL